MFYGWRIILVIYIIILFGLSIYINENSIQKSNLDDAIKLNYQSLEKRPDPCLFGKTFPNGTFYLNLCKNIENIIGNSSIVDFGSGLGQYGSCFLKNLNYEKIHPSDMTEVKRNKKFLTDALTYDDALNIEKKTHHLEKNLDLSISFDLGRKFDWVLNLEVGEHVPPKEAEEVFFRNLIHHSCKGIILSWSMPGQEGLRHMNNQPNGYIISKMKRNGLILCHFQDTVMVFRRSKPLC